MQGKNIVTSSGSDCILELRRKQKAIKKKKERKNFIRLIFQQPVLPQFGKLNIAPVVLLCFFLLFSVRELGYP